MYRSTTLYTFYSYVPVRTEYAVLEYCKYESRRRPLIRVVQVRVVRVLVQKVLLCTLRIWVRRTVYTFYPYRYFIPVRTVQVYLYGVLVLVLVYGVRTGIHTAKLLISALRYKYSTFCTVYCIGIYCTLYTDTVYKYYLYCTPRRVQYNCVGVVQAAQGDNRGIIGFLIDYYS